MGFVQVLHGGVIRSEIRSCSTWGAGVSRSELPQDKSRRDIPAFLRKRKK